MNKINRRGWVSVLCVAVLLAACSDSIDAPVLDEQESVTMASGVRLAEDQLFGVWSAASAYGTTNANHFEQSYRIDFMSVADGDALVSHWYVDADSESRDSVYQVPYTYTFNGTTVTLKPKSAASGMSSMQAVHVGNNRMVLYIQHQQRTDSVCTLVRAGDPEPSITAVDRTMPAVGETVTVTGRNLQFVDHVYLPTKDGEIEVTNVTKGSKQISFVVPEADYRAGSVRCQSTSAHVSCYSPAYMFCDDCVFMRNFSTFGTKAPFTGTEFEYSITVSSSTPMGNVSALKTTNLPAGHSLLEAAAGVAHPDSLLSFFGDTPQPWDVDEKTDPSKGYLRFSSGDRFQYVLDHCDGLLTSRTRCADAAIQMDIYVYSNGQAEWNTGYLSYRLNKDQSSLTSSMVANVAAWETAAPMSFADGWRTLTIPLSLFSATRSDAMSTLGGLVSSLKGSNLQTIVKVVNYPLDEQHPCQPLTTFQFSIANMRLVPYAIPRNTRE